KQYARVRQVYHLCLLYGISMMVLGSLLLRFSAEFWIGLFSDSHEVVIQGVHFLRVEALVLPTYVILFMGTSVLQGLKKPEYALFLNIYRLVLGPLLLFWFLIEIQGWGIDGIWWGIFWVNWIGVLLNLSLVHYFLPKDE
ncbi:MAG: MATE family efflux transporter, partial [SAR324 cluster bacterium]|nr:MATE family efflux transporter [SAR324 cluster bacterium]